MMRARVLLLATSMSTLLLAGGLVAANRSGQGDLFRALGNLAETVHLVHTEYVDEVSLEALAQSLEAGIVESFDPRAAVLADGDVDAYTALLELPPPFGLVVSGRLSSAAVRATVPGSPADAAELEPWEIIELLDGVYTRGRPLSQIRLELARREAAGEKVTLTVIDHSVDERREVVLEPRPWQPEVAAVTAAGDATVVSISSLPAGAAARVAELLPVAGPALVDLRGLAWGLDAEAIAVADLFADDGELGVWRGRRSGEKRFAAQPGRAVVWTPIVLVDASTEGAGEVLAAALQRVGATIVGRATAGGARHLGLVHDNDLHLWLPVASWLDAHGETLDGRGLEPDVEVEVEAEVEAGEGDPILERAKELLRERLAAAA